MATRKKKNAGRPRAAKKSGGAMSPAAVSILLFALGALLFAMVFVPGDAVWHSIRTALFGVFGAGMYVLGVLLIYFAVLVGRGEALGTRVLKCVLGLLFLSGTAVVFSKLEIKGLDFLAALRVFYRNGCEAVFGGGVMGMLAGGLLLSLCGRPAANIIFIILAMCVAMFIMGVTPAELWESVEGCCGSLQEHHSAAKEEFHALREERRQANLEAEQRAQDEEDAADYDEDDDYDGEQAPRHVLPAWLSRVFGAGRLPAAEEDADTQTDDAARRAAEEQQRAAETAARLGMQPGAAAPSVTPPDFSSMMKNTPAPEYHAPFDVALGPDASAVRPGQSEPIEPVIIGPGGTFGFDALRAEEQARAAADTQGGTASASGFFGTNAAPGFGASADAQGAGFAASAPSVPDADEFSSPIVPPRTEMPGAPQVILPDGVPQGFAAPGAGFAPSAAGASPLPGAAPVSAENAAAARSAPDADGWIRITADPVNAADLNTLVAAAMEKPQASEQAAAAAPTEPTAPVNTYHYPPLSLFEKQVSTQDNGAQDELKANAQKLVETLESFGVKTRVLDISRGPSVTRYELQPLAGVKISRITSLADDIALNLAVAGVRMEAPIPGKPAVGIEVPNRKSTAVSIRSIFESQSYAHMASPLTVALGKDIAGVAQVADLCKMPHLLIAGSTGSGKSVCVNSIIISFLYRSSPEDVKLILIDPKVVELAEYNGIPHLLMPVVTEPRKAAGALGSAVTEMERRYRLFADNNVRDIKTFNKLAQETDGMEKLPYIAIVIDELADLMMVAGKEVEDSICRIAQKARAAGMHLIVATQRPSVDVITGLIKANIPSRIAFAVSSQVDSRTILDGGGAEKLLGMGDMLFMPVGAPKPTRIQGTYVKDEEISRVLDYIKKDGAAAYDESMIAEMEKQAAQEKGGSNGASDDEANDDDPMLKSAVEVVIDAGQASTSLLQRRCKLGYARAARIMDEMEQRGIIGPYEGAKPRAVLVSRQQWLEMNVSRSDAGIPDAQGLK